MNFILEFTKDQFAQENLPVSDVVISGVTKWSCTIQQQGFL